MHNNIMAAGLKDQPPMLAMGIYAQWRSRILRFIGTKPNGDALRKCILEDPYKPTTIIAIEWLQQGESLNIQDVKTDLFWEFGKFTSRDADSMESYYSRSNAPTRHKGKEIAKPVTPPTESDSDEDSDSEQAQKEKEIQKNLVLIEKYFKKLYKPTNNNLRTSSNSKNKTVDTSPSQVVQQNRIQCFNCKEFRHFAKECKKLKRVKDYTYHKENILLCKQAEKGVPLQVEQADRLEDTDEEIY
uniref:Retrovirus-related Pol polyprotein from transposon TNT 1-94 n=1 Tax=Tanacetum cinerariifolium TaxID=118510 RepID=A0A6L2M0M5_TANCI|nr:retrovirus-related Pol polyprotein from transposon TNT 1-94 [Tanacetum cinerariifolium]